MTLHTKTTRLAGPPLRTFALACGLGLFGAAPTQAQWFGFNDGPLPPGAIVRALMQQGFVDIGRPRFNGRVYVVDGVNARGFPVRLVIDAYDGGVLSRARLERPLLPPSEIGPPRGRPGSRFEEAEEFVPPRRIPGPDRDDLREAVPRRAERPDYNEPREAAPRRAARPEFDDLPNIEARRAERPEPRQNRSARNESPPLRDTLTPVQPPASSATRAPAESLPTSSVEPASRPDQPAKNPAATAAITTAPLDPPETAVVPSRPAAPVPSVTATIPPAQTPEVSIPAKPIAPVEVARPAESAPTPAAPRSVRVIPGVTPIGPRPAAP